MNRTSWIFVLALCIIFALPGLLSAQQVVFVGDILCTDGSTVRVNEFAASGKTALGVVYYVDNSGQNGLAVNLYDDATDIEYGGYGEDFPIPDIEESRKAICDFNGYSNTAAMRSMYGGSYWYPAVWSTDFDNGWYIPAAGELRLLYNHLLTVNNSLVSVGGTALYANTDNYWSSTERTCYHMHDLTRNGNLGNYTKVMASNPAFVGVRSIRSFTTNSIGFGIGSVITNNDGSKGVVFYLNPDEKAYWMVALNDAPMTCQWGDLTDTPLPNLQPEQGYYLLNQHGGMSNTATLRDYQGNDSYAAFKPDFENGWYLPAAGQLSKLYGALPLIEDSITMAGGTLMRSDLYWTSSEYDAGKAWCVDYGSPGYYGGFFSSKNKSDYAYVRAIRDFDPVALQPYVGEIVAPEEICSGTSLVLQTPETQHASYEGWQLSPDAGFSNSQPYNGENLDESYNGWYLRYFVSNFNGTVYSNVLQVFVLHAPTSSFSVSSCESYTWNDETYTESGDYTQYFPTANGCDSVVTCHLTIGQSYENSFALSSCDFCIWNGVTYTQSGDYEQLYTSQMGCDSIVVMHLTIKQSTNSELMIAACDSYNWNGTEYTQSGDYEQVFVGHNGCDSIVTLHLSIENFDMMQAIDGDAEVDSYLTPSSIYVQPGFMSATTYQWNLVPVEAGTIIANGNTLIVNWSSDYRGEVALNVHVNNACGEGENTIVVNVKNSFDVDENDANVKVYPNPTSDDITIEANAMQHLTVMNALGQMVVDRDLDADSINLDMSQFGVGVYVVRIQMRDGICTKRISVK